MLCDVPLMHIDDVTNRMDTKAFWRVMLPGSGVWVLLSRLLRLQISTAHAGSLA